VNELADKCFRAPEEGAIASRGGEYFRYEELKVSNEETTDASTCERN
jgi:hypothetical protein